MAALSLWLVVASLVLRGALALSSFAGVNHYFLAALDGTTQRNVIQKIVNGNANVIRTFMGPWHNGAEKGQAIISLNDIESAWNTFDPNFNGIMDVYDNMLKQVYDVSGGKTKVILALHNANTLANNYGTCDVYCQHYGSSWHNFYTDPTGRAVYKRRLHQILNVYVSKNFGVPWSQLSKVILAIDLQNEPLVGQGLSVPFSDWVCDISTYIRAELGSSNIAVATGALRGANDNSFPTDAAGNNPYPDHGINWPSGSYDGSTDVFACHAIDIISIHGYYGPGTVTGQGSDAPWYRLMIQAVWGGQLVKKALDAGKLVMAEEWVHLGPSSTDETSQSSDIWAQSHALNVRGVPWIYWDVMSGSESCSGCNGNEVSLDGGTGSSWEALSGQMAEAYGSSSAFDWSKYFPSNPKSIFLVESTTNPYGNSGSSASGSCTWGCTGWQCSANSPCQGDLECVSGVCKACSWGCTGWNCSPTSPCKDTNECSSGVCKACDWGCQGWACSAGAPCQGENECVNGICKACSWGCLGWACSASSVCKVVNQCANNVCEQCQWGCPGWACSAASPCQGDGECKNGACGPCTWGCLGWTCSASSPCKGQNECVSGACKPCSWGCKGWACSASSPCKSGTTCSSGVCK